MKTYLILLALAFAPVSYGAQQVISSANSLPTSLPKINDNFTELYTGMNGVRSVATGGTGQSTYTNGQILIGNTTGNTLAKGTLTGTANEITVTNGGGSITLSLPSALTFTGKTITGGTFVGPALGTPAALVGTNITGTGASFTAGAVPVSGITGLGADVGNLLAAFSSANLLAALQTSTGTGTAVFGTSPTFTTSVILGTAGVSISDDGDGAITFLGRGDGSDENLTLNFDDTANTIVVSSSTGVASITFGAIGLSTDTITLSGTGTLNGLVAIDATTESTIEAAMDTLVNVTSIQGQTVTMTGAFIRSGAHSLTLTTSGTTTVTLPTSGTLAVVDSPIFTTVVGIPSAAAPTTDAAGEIAFDNNAWAVSRGTMAFFDGTATVWAVGALASDTPTNGQVPTWNTGGTITWETPASGSSLTSTLVGYGSGANALTGEAAFAYDATTNTLTVDNITSTGTQTVGTVNATTLEFEGSTADANELTFVITDPTADRSVTFGNTGGTVMLSGATVAQAYDLGGDTSFEIPNAAAPTVDAFGEIAGDNNLWAASRGAPIFFDGTASTALVNVLVSDTPSNGQVPMWNTGGTITWETPSGSGTVTVVSAGSLTSTALVTGGGTTTLQTPSATSTLDASGNVVFVGTGSATRFLPTGSTVPTNGLYLPAANTLGWGINSGAEMQLTATALAPAADGGNSLGTTALGWQNLFGNTGFVLNIENSDWVATHTTGILTVGTGDLRVTTAGTNSASVVTVGGTQTLTAKTLTSPTLTTPSAFTTGGSITLAENSTVALDPAGSADGKYTGVTVTGTAGYTQAFGDLVYLDPTDSRWELCDANSASGADGDSRGMVAMVVSAGTDGTACTLLLSGIIRADAKFATFTVNNPIYISETAGAITQTQPVTADVVIRIIGAAITADEIYFRPDWVWTTHL